MKMMVDMKMKVKMDIKMKLEMNSDGDGDGVKQSDDHVKPLTLLGIVWHLDMVYGHLWHVMEEDSREGIRGVVRLLYPDIKEEGDQEEEEQRQRNEEVEIKQKKDCLPSTSS